MKTERLNLAIFYVCGAVFLLQSIGYLAPAWFIKEMENELDELKAFSVDGKSFKLPYWTDEDGLNTGEGMEAESPDGVPDKRRKTRGASFSDAARAETPMQIISDVDETKAIVGTILTSTPVFEKRHKDMSDDAMGNTQKPFQEKPVFSPENTDYDQKTDIIKEQDGSKPNNTDIIQEQDGSKQKTDTVSPVDKQPHNTMAPDGMTSDGMHVVYLNAGLWFARICVNSRQLGDMASPGVEWCTIYGRTNEYSLDNIMYMMELRLEASFGLGFSLLSLLVACTGCCSHRRHGTRMIISLSSLFISGAVMAIPVVHVLVQHVNKHDNILRHRNWMNVHINAYMKHDLFDHWSPIVCGVACIISILSVLLFTILACRSSNKPPSNCYKLQQPAGVEANVNLGMHWITNKVTVPQETTIVDEVPSKEEDFCDDMYTKLDEDTHSASVHDGGDSVKGGNIAGGANEAFEYSDVNDGDSVASEI